MDRSRQVMIIVVASLIGIGLVMVFSTSAVTAGYKYKDSEYFLQRQLMWTLLSIIGMLVASRVDIEFLRRCRWLLLGTALLFLVAVLVPGIGRTVHGARRWIRFGPIGVQPSELAKICLIIFMSDYLALNLKQIKDRKYGFLIPASIAAAACGLIVIEPDLGSAVLLGIVLFSLITVAGARFLYLAPSAVAGCGAFVGFVAIKPYRVARIMAFINPWDDPQGKGFHIIQSLVALGSGGVGGIGLSQSRQKLFFLPEASTDFIFAVIGEELGLIGTSGVVLLFICLILTGIRICNRQTDPFRYFLSFGLLCSIGLQAAINIAVVTASVPTKGLSLPFISFGGSSLFFTMVGVGLLLNIGRTDAGTGRGLQTSDSRIRK